MKTSILNNIALLLLIVLTSSCKMNTKEDVSAQETSQEAAVTEEETENPILLGIQKRATLEAAPYSDWFTINYKEHTIDTATIQTIKNNLAATDITIFMGTWCEDSQRETPAFYKILDVAGISSDKVKLITVSEDKDTPEGLEEGMNITNVPTLIFSNGDEELGRIVEYPLESLEKDMAKILTGQEYKHAYEE